MMQVVSIASCKMMFNEEEQVSIDKISFDSSLDELGEIFGWIGDR